MQLTPIQKFCLENIYNAPRQDFQFSFQLYKVNKLPIKRTAYVYNNNIRLPDDSKRYDVFVIGQIHPIYLNMLMDRQEWFRDHWIKFSEDLTTRNILLRLYSQDGRIYPIEYCYYSYIDERSMVIACDASIRETFNLDIESMYLHMYSNSYYSLANTPDLLFRSSYARNIQDIVALQNWANNAKQNGGEVLVYVNGIYTDLLHPAIKTPSYIEVIYDPSIVSKTYHPLTSLRQFTSRKDLKTKYLVTDIFNKQDTIFFDDIELYVALRGDVLREGRYFYRHKDYVLRNVTDKDISLYTTYVDNMARLISPSNNSIDIVSYVRKSGMDKELVYSSWKLHELYKLPLDKQRSIMDGTWYTIEDLRVEYLEDNRYQDLSNAKQLHEITRELTTSVLGYDAVVYYFGKSYQHAISDRIDVPQLYHTYSLAYEYDQEGRLINYYPSSGPVYTVNNTSCRYIEFLRGRKAHHLDRLYDHDETITLDPNYSHDIALYKAYHQGSYRVNAWEDITTKYTIVDGKIQLQETLGDKIYIAYADKLAVDTIDYSIEDGFIHFPLVYDVQTEQGLERKILDLPFGQVDVFIDGVRLHYGIDYIYKDGYIGICNKEYINSSTPKVHVRAFGYLYKETNSLIDTGFIHQGAIGRNAVYDIRDDRNILVYIDGALIKPENVIHADTDNLVRVNDRYNGKPYTVVENFIGIRDASGLPTHDYYIEAKKKDEEFSNFFTQVSPEPQVQAFQVIQSKHVLYSPILSKLIVDMKQGSMPGQIYMTPYDDQSVLEYIETNYGFLKPFDPLFLNLDPTYIEIHPYIKKETIDLNIFQYRYLERVVKLIGHDKVILSGRVNMTT